MCSMPAPQSSGAPVSVKGPPGTPAGGAPQVWVRHPEGGLRPIAVRTGITDGISTEILEGPLKEGDAVILGTTRRE